MFVKSVIVEEMFRKREYSERAYLYVSICLVRVRLVDITMPVVHRRSTGESKAPYHVAMADGIMRKALAIASEVRGFSWLRIMSP